MSAFAASTAMVILGGAVPALAQDVAAATKEGAVSIYTATDISQAETLVKAFEAKYPGIEVKYNDLGTNGTYNRAISEYAAGQVGADIIWTSGMDQELKLYNDGLLQEYKSTQLKDLPDWAAYQNTVYASTIEPVGMMYNTIAFPDGKGIPKTRAELLTLLQSDQRVKGKVATFDPEKSGAGFLFATNEARTSPDSFWAVSKAFGASNGKTYSSSGAMKESVISGENAFAYNIIGSYAIDWAKANKTLGVAFFSDNNAAFSRLIAIANGAPHPEAAKLFIDFALSKEGQESLAAKGLPSVRSDTSTGMNAKNLADAIGGPVTPIKVDEGLLEYMGQTKRVKFMNDWRAALGK
ncbi:ABC transporter substrate-binding protein [Radicibacter daui]|uniref:ABC transporter substrate-binding protein n=1 Tax=Radicibacter daui TaxID=3064829 RepID=UPI004046F693